ncbi:TetR/AcrR family transcriptional regulator [Caulobacter sp. KR2-114]|uniref:TetR/AcrR family transcriptional regulator n=1 Tax=Caulobacter sp. KR2-114 TaxID=3400912 RepID=UPI003C004512
MPEPRRTSTDTDKTTPTRKRILKAARELFADRGYTATSVSQIARRADVLPGSMYWAFESKERMFAAALEDAAEEWRVRLGPRTGEIPALRPGDVHRRLAPYADAFTAAPDFMRLLMIVATEPAAGTPQNLAAAAAVRERWREAFDEALGKTFAGHDPDTVQKVARRLGRLMLQLLDGLHVALQLEPGVASPRELFMEAADVFERELAFAMARMGEPAPARG